MNVPVVHGTCALYLRVTTRKGRRLTHAYYHLTAVEDGWRLTTRQGKHYDVSAQGVCDCPDATYRMRACKHARALVKLGLVKEHG
jgi:hypothetical protein